MVNTFTLGPTLKWIKKLDMTRTWKQVVEAHQLIKVLKYYDKHGEFKEGAGWTNHPAMKMWIGHTKALKKYFNYVLKICKKAGYNTKYEYYENVDHCEIISCTFDGTTATFSGEANENTFPIWYAFPPFYLAQRAALIMKNSKYYTDIFLDDEVKSYMGKGYLWPCNHSDKIYKKWKMKYLEELGTGIPPEYRISEKDAKRWSKDKYTNPLTGRAITKSGTIYKDYKRAAKFFGII